MDIKGVKNLETMLQYLKENCDWNIDFDMIEDMEDITYGFEAEDIGLKQEEFNKIKGLSMIRPLLENQPWGIFSIEFESNHFEVTALRKILSGLIPRRRNMYHAVWDKKELIFFCFWGIDDEKTIGIARFDDSEVGLPTIKINYCTPAVEDLLQISAFEDKLKALQWPQKEMDFNEWSNSWSRAFGNRYRQVIRDSQTLIVELAKVAKSIQDSIMNIMSVETSNGYVHLLYDKFRNVLIHDLSKEQFADMYAQTVVYGLFSAKCMGDEIHEFNPLEAIEQIPNTNPFLKSLMKECISNASGKLSFDELGISDIVNVLKSSDTEAIIGDFNRQTGGGKEDPVIYFYEGFLDAYEKEQKKRSGVYYTPSQVVNFMVRSVDLVLREEFNITKGLESEEVRTINVQRESKTKIKGIRRMVNEKVDVHAVQILDPATGTGTFLRQVILQIYTTFRKSRKFDSQIEFIEEWNKYVNNNLLPRLNGFEIMMAPYAVAHMKLAMLLKETGYKFEGNNRLKVFLTNSLEKAGNSEYQISLWSDPLATEAIEANITKKNSCINVCIGNPPYNAASQNNDEWIMELLKVYKMEPGGMRKLDERNPKWLNDDYVKFIRLCEEYISKSGQGVLAFINPHGFIDNPTFRGMRWELLRTFDRIYVIDLHGNSNRQERCPDGSKDENVFDIQQGVSINIFIKSNTNERIMADVFHADLWGLRENKYDFLKKHSLYNMEFEKVDYQAPLYLFKKQDNDLKAIYDEGFSVVDLFILNGVGITTAHDDFVISEKRQDLIDKFNKFRNIDPGAVDLYKEFNVKTKAGWDIMQGWNNLQDGANTEEYIYPIMYRPFDAKYIFYEDKLVWRTVRKIMGNFILGDNVGLVTARTNKSDDCDHFYLSKYMMETKCGERTTQSAIFPLYIYKEYYGEIVKSLNLNKEIVAKFENILDMKMSEVDKKEYFSPINLLDYLYAVLYSCKYREKYRAFLKMDFPKIPYPSNADIFLRMAEKGAKLRCVHLMEKEICVNYINFIEGSGVIDRIKYANGKIYINSNQYFENVSEDIWNFGIGGYKPLQKWLKDRKNTKLNELHIEHYKYIIAALVETSEIMKEIDKIYEV